MRSTDRKPRAEKADPRSRACLFFIPGKDKETFAEFEKELLRRGLEPEQVEEIAMDMPPSFIAAAQAGGLPRGALWASRGNVWNLKEEQVAMREKICREHSRIARALSIRDYLADTWNYAAEADAREHLEAVTSWCARSRMNPFVKQARSLRSHMEGIPGYFRNYTTSAAVEAVNGLLQLARRRARGYRRFEKFRAIAYWIAGGLKINGHPNTAHYMFGRSTKTKPWNSNGKFPHFRLHPASQHVFDLKSLMD